uniref:Serpentine receptor class gamma n=1 Tax=Caenorhabditis tropicalis TaxID=1561998 RepID=A0A1I7U9Q3_9PELO
MSTAESFIVNLEEVTVDTKTEIFTAIQLIYGIPSLAMLIMCFILIFFGKNYGNSFYFLVRFDLLTNICVYLNTWIAIRLEMHPNTVFILKAIESALPGSLTIFKYIPYFFFHMHFWTSALLTAHRLSSVLFIYKYEAFWSSWRNRIIMLIIIFICSHLPKYLWTGWLFEVYIVNDALICYNFPDALKDAYKVVGFFSIVYAITNLTMGLLTACLVSKKLGSKSTNNVSRKLTRVAISYSAAYFFELLWSVINSVNSYLNFLPDSIVEIDINLLVFASDGVGSTG